MNPREKVVQERVVITTTNRPGNSTPDRLHVPTQHRSFISPETPPVPTAVRLPASNKRAVRRALFNDSDSEYHSFTRGMEPAYSTPRSGAKIPPMHESLGSTIGHYTGDFSQSFEYYDKPPGVPAKYQYNNVMISSGGSSIQPQEASSSIDSRMFSSQRSRSAKKKEKDKTSESILQWFDRTCERELSKRSTHPYSLEVSQMRGLSRPENIAASSISGMELADMLDMHQTTEMLDACDKLAKAQAIDMFKGAVRAAEEAAANAPPEFAEEAAAAGARGYQAELTSVVQEKIPGAKPMEVIGYVGVTRPRKPKIPKKPY